MGRATIERERNQTGHRGRESRPVIAEKQSGTLGAELNRELGTSADQPARPTLPENDQRILDALLAYGRSKSLPNDEAYAIHRQIAPTLARGATLVLPGSVDGQPLLPPELAPYSLQRLGGPGAVRSVELVADSMSGVYAVLRTESQPLVITEEAKALQLAAHVGKVFAAKTPPAEGTSGLPAAQTQGKKVAPARPEPVQPRPWNKRTGLLDLGLSKARYLTADLFGAPYKVAAQSWIRHRNVDVKAILSVVSGAELWHGTGRYHYANKGDHKYAGTSNEVVDVLDGILSRGGLKPFQDPYVKTESKATISLAPCRMFSRIFAQQHQPQNVDLQFEYGHNSGWYNLLQARNGSLETTRTALQWFVPKLKGEADLGSMWSSVRKDTSQVALRFGFGTIRSDITNNHGILFGVKRGVVDPVKMPWYLERIEARSGEPILFDQMTHVEVPLRQVDEVRAILRGRGIDLPVLAMEDVEAALSTVPVDDIIHGNIRRP